MSDIAKALYLMVGGMALVFTALAALFLAMVVLERVFRTSDEEAGEEKEKAVGEETSESVDLDREKAAAIAAALAILTEESTSERPAARPMPGHPGGQPSSWRTFGRQDLMQSRIRRRNRL